MRQKREADGGARAKRSAEAHAGPCAAGGFPLASLDSACTVTGRKGTANVQPRDDAGASISRGNPPLRSAAFIDVTTAVRDFFLGSLGYIASVLAIAAIVIAARHLPETQSERWPARRVVIALTAIAAVLGFFQAWRSGLLAQGVNLLNQTIAADEIRLMELQQRLSAAEHSERLLRRIAQTDQASVHELRWRLALSEGERTTENAALQSAVRKANQRIAAVRAQANSIGEQGRRAIAEAQAAAAESKRTAADVARTDAETIRRSKEALTLAQSAAEKARVFHFGAPLLSAAAAMLARETAGATTISCVPGYETACTDLRSAFVSAGWPKPFIARAASLYTGAGLDAPSDPNPDDGLLIFYRPGRERLARSLAAILAPAGFTIGVYPLSFNPGNHEFEISVRFLDQ